MPRDVSPLDAMFCMPGRKGEEKGGKGRKMREGDIEAIRNALEQLARSDNPIHAKTE